MIGLVVDEAPGERLPHDLADPLRRDLLLAGDFVIGVALAQAGEDAPAPQRRPARVKPPLLLDSRRHVAHIRLAYPPPVRRPFSKAGMIAPVWEIGNDLSGKRVHG